MAHGLARGPDCQAPSNKANEKLQPVPFDSIPVPPSANLSALPPLCTCNNATGNGGSYTTDRRLIHTDRVCTLIKKLPGMMVPGSGSVSHAYQLDCAYPLCGRDARALTASRPVDQANLVHCVVKQSAASLSHEATIDTAPREGGGRSRCCFPMDVVNWFPGSSFGHGETARLDGAKWRLPYTYTSPAFWSRILSSTASFSSSSFP